MRRTPFVMLFLSCSLTISACQTTPPAAVPRPSASIPAPILTPVPVQPSASAPTSPLISLPSPSPLVIPPLVLPSGSTAEAIAVLKFSRTEGVPGMSVELIGTGLDRIEKILLGGIAVTITSATSQRLIFTLPSTTNGDKPLEIFTAAGKLTPTVFRLIGGISTTSGGGGGGGGGGGTPNSSGFPTHFPSPIKDSTLVTVLPSVVLPSLENFVPIIDPEQAQGQARESVPSRNLTTTVLTPSAVESIEGGTNNPISLPVVVGLGLDVEDDSFRVQTAFYNNLDPVFAYQGGALPIAIDLRPNDTAIRSQGSRGTCTFYAWAGLMDYLLRQANRYQGPTSGLSPQFLSWLYQEEVARYQTLDESPVYGEIQVQFFIHTDNNLNNPNSYVLLETHFFPNDNNLQTNIDQAWNSFFNSSAYFSWAQQGNFKYWYWYQPIQTSTVQTISEGSNIERVGELLDANSPADFGSYFGFTSNQGTVTDGFIPYPPPPSATPIPVSALANTRQQRAQNILGTAVAQFLATTPVPVHKLRTYRITNQTNSLKAVLSQGKPLVIGMPTFVTSATADFGQESDDSPWNMLNRNSLETAKIDYKPNGNITSDGNHAVLLVGYRDQVGAPGGGYFIVRNSWGTDWGYQGYALISYDYIQKYAFSYPMTADLVPYNLQSYIDLPENGSQMLLNLVNVPTGTRQLSMEIKAANLVPLLSVTPYRSAGQLAHEYRINVPPGTGREVTVSAYGTANQLLGKAQLFNQSLSNQEKKTLTLDFQSNRPPVISAVSAQPTSLVGAGHTTRLNCQAQDPDGSALTYSWSTVGGSFGSFSAPSSAQTFWTTPTPASSAYTLRCSVSDGTHTVTQDYSMAVANSSGNINGTGGLY